MKRLLPILLLTTITTISFAQNKLKYAIGAITDSSARVVVMGDTIRGVFYWNALTLSDHEGDKYIETAGLIIKDTVTQTWVYELYDLKPGIKYGMFVLYRDTLIRDTITIGGTRRIQGKFNWWKENYIYNGKTFTYKHFDKMMKAKARLTYVRIKHDEDED